MPAGEIFIKLVHLCFGGSAFLLGRVWHGEVTQTLREGDLEKSFSHMWSQGRGGTEQTHPRGVKSCPKAGGFIQLQRLQVCSGVSPGSRLL